MRRQFTGRQIVVGTALAFALTYATYVVGCVVIAWSLGVPVV